MADDTITKISLVDPIQVNVAIPNFEGKAGRDGTDGHDGRDGDDAYRVAVRNGFIGTEQEWLASLGGGGQIKETLKEFKKHNVWLDNTSLDNVLLKILSLSNCLNNAQFADLRYDPYHQGQLFIDFYGEPHFYIKINDGEKREFIENKLRVSLDGSMGNTLTVKYYGINDEVIQTESISLITESSSAGELGALLSTVSVSDLMSEHYATSVPSNTQGTIEKHSKGAKITLTNVPFSPYTVHAFYKDLFKSIRETEDYTDDKNINTFIIDVTACPQSSKGTFPSDTFPNTWNTMWEYADTIIVKLKPENLPSGTLDKTTVRIIGKNGKRIKINDSEMITCKDNVPYIYHFNDNSVEELNLV